MNLREEIIIGFADPLTQQSKDADDDFPSLLGGEPVWLNQKSCPESVKCQLCQGDMTFLLQLYTPLEMEHAYHRVIYIFFCNSPACQNRKESFKILRAQQKSSDEITNYKSEKFAKNILEKAFKISTDVVETKETLMLDREYMKISQPFEVDDKEYQVSYIKKGEKKETYEKENSLIKQFAQMAMEDPDFGNKLDKFVAESYEDDKDDEDDSDPCFDKFCYLLQKQDYHIIRYCRVKDTTPLWYSEKKQWTTVPKCKHCNKNLTFEFQVNSSVLNHIPSLIEKDWGIIAIYTCENSCKGKEVTEEHAEIQVVLEKEQIEDNLKKHMQMNNENDEEEEEEEEDEEEVTEEQKKDEEKSDQNNKQPKEEEEIPCGDTTQTTTTSETEKPKQKKNKKKKAQQEKQEEEEVKNESEGEDW